MELSLLPVSGSSNHTLFSSPVTLTMNSDETDVDFSIALMTVRPVMSLPLAPIPAVLSSSEMLEPVFVISWNTSWSYSQFTSASTVFPAFVVALAETVMKSSSSMSIDAELPESVIDVILFWPNMSMEHESSMDTERMIAINEMSLVLTFIFPPCDLTFDSFLFLNAAFKDCSPVRHLLRKCYLRDVHLLVVPVASGNDEEWILRIRVDELIVPGAL